MAARRGIGIVSGVVGAGLLLGACAVGPPYAPPKPAASSSGPFVSAAAGAATGQPLPDDWWRLYQDPVLDRLVQRALVENRDLRVAAANLENARALIGEARAGLFPSTDVSAGADYGRSAAANAAAAAKGQQAKDQWTYDAGFAAAYEVDLFGRVRRAIEAARADADAVQAAEDAVRISVAAQTTQAYVDLCAAAQQAAVARQSLEVVRQTYDITVRQRDAGAVSDFDVARAATLLRQSEAAIPVFDGQRRVALYELAALLGLAPADAPADAAACRGPPTLSQPLPVGDGAALIRRRPDVREAERRLAGDTARIGVATANLYPAVSLNGSVATAASVPSQLTAHSAVSFGLGPLITWSFPNTALAHAQIRAARATAQASLAGFDSAVLQALKETEQALSTYSADLDRHGSLAAARDEADRALSLAQVQQRAGAISFLDLLQAETVAVAADQALAAADQQVASDQVAVFKALGGGWETAPAVVPEALRR